MRLAEAVPGACPMTLGGYEQVGAAVAVAVAVAVGAAVGAASVRMVHVSVSDPARLMTVSVTVNVWPSPLKVCATVALPTAVLPSPKSHCQSVGLPLEVEALKLTVSGAPPVVGLATHWATGGGGSVAVFGVGRYSICAVAEALIGMVWPPKMIDRRGVRS